MSPKKYENASRAALETYIPTKNFRTVAATLLGLPAGFSEYRVDISVSPAFAQRLSFKVAWDGKIFGFTHGSAALDALFAAELDDGKGKGKLFLNDWDDKFLLLLTSAGGRRELPFFVDPDDVVALLSGCRLGKG
jgi:hypothetical protein